MFAGGLPFDLTEGDLLAVFSQACHFPVISALVTSPLRNSELAARVCGATVNCNNWNETRNETQYGEILDVNLVRDDTGACPMRSNPRISLCQDTTSAAHRAQRESALQANPGVFASLPTRTSAVPCWRWTICLARALRGASSESNTSMTTS